jgi:RNA polymerase sigma-70 factor (ECF subfamily)
VAGPYRERQAAPDGGSPSRDTLDRELLDRVRLGDQSALQSLLDQYWSSLVRYAARVLGGFDAAEDVAQEAFVRLWDRRAEWREHRSARVLLYIIVRNLCLNRRKSTGTRARLLSLRLYSGSSPATPADLLEGSELDRALEAAVAALPARRREVLLLARHDALSRTEIAALLRLSPQTVANHLTLALAQLRRALAPFLRGAD